MNPPSSFPMCSRPTHRARFGLRSALLCSAALIPALGGCQAAGEDYVAPKLEVAEVEAWNGRFEGVITQEDLDPKVLAEWWTTLEDPTLTALVKDAVESNLDLRVASAQLRQARGARKVAGSAGEPQIGTSAGATRSGSSANAGPGGTNDLYSAGVDASWELDVFGGIQRQVEAAEADEQAVAEVRRDVLVSVSAEVALNYADLRALQSRARFARLNLSFQEATLTVVQSKVKAGAASQLDLSRAESQVSSTRAALPALNQQETQVKNRLAVLLGMTPGSLDTRLAAGPSMAVPDIRVAVGVPGDVLRRRPDVRGAERRLAAEAARLGASIAELYPKFSLGASIGLESLSIPDLFQAASRAFSFGPRIQWSPLNGGRLKAQVEIQEAVQEETLLRYESTVLLALEEVENAISAYAQDQLRYRSLEEAAASARVAETLAKQRFDLGATDFLTLLDAQRVLLDAEDYAATSAGEVVGDLIRLYKALGGGWDPANEGIE